MADSFITKCPNCSTFFRVRTDQLAMANGSVRCGACLQVFNAQTNLSSRSIAINKSNTQPASSQSTPLADTEVHEKQSAQAAVTSVPTPKPETQKKERAEAESAKTEVELVEDIDTEVSNNLDTQGVDSESAEPAEKLSTIADDASEDSSARSQPSMTQENALTPTELDIESDPPLDFELFKDHLPSQEFVEAAKETKKQRRIRHKKRPKPNASQVVTQASQSIEHDFPFEARIHRLRPLGWLAIVLLLCLAIGQWAWYKRDTYAKMDQWRGIYSAVCDRLGCQLPTQSDLLSIRTSIQVREAKDPALSDILIVDVVLTNRATFKQKFPALVLQYTDLNGKLIADQAFQPSDYLRGEMTGVELMPVNTRIYAVLAIKRPDPSAINYQLLLAPAKESTVTSEP